MTAAKPWTRALELDLALPSAVFGPRDLDPLSRDCSEWVSFSGVSGVSVFSGMGCPFGSKLQGGVAALNGVKLPSC